MPVSGFPFSATLQLMGDAEKGERREGEIVKMLSQSNFSGIGDYLQLLDGYIEKDPTNKNLKLAAELAKRRLAQLARQADEVYKKCQ